MTPSLFTQRLQAWLAFGTWIWMLGTARLWFVLDRPEPIPLLVPWPSWLHIVGTAVLAGAATLLAFRPRHRRAQLVLAGTLIVMMLCDQLRAQPITLLLTLAGFVLFFARRLDGRAGDRMASDALRIGLAGFYVALAIARLEPSFTGETAATVLRQMGVLRPAGWQQLLLALPLIALPLAAAWALVAQHRRGALLAWLTHAMALAVAGTAEDPAAPTVHVVTGALLALLLYRSPSPKDLLKRTGTPGLRWVLAGSLLFALVHALGLLRPVPGESATGSGFVVIQGAWSGWEGAAPDRRQALVMAATDASGPWVVDADATARRVFGVRAPGDALALRRLHARACAHGEAFLIRIERATRWSSASSVVSRRCSGEERRAEAPPFLR